jgi:hypothetical protein
MNKKRRSNVRHKLLLRTHLGSSFRLTTSCGVVVTPRACIPVAVTGAGEPAFGPALSGAAEPSGLCMEDGSGTGVDGCSTGGAAGWMSAGVE